MIGRKDSRLRRLKSTRFIIKKSDMARLCVHRTPRHIYAQIILPNASVIAAASSLSSAVKDTDSYTGNVDTAKKVGKLVAELAIAAGVKKVAFDRSGFRYHGRVKALADSAREAGLEF